jgi:hypothetical protein
MTVKQLKQLLEHVPDEAAVIIEFRSGEDNDLQKELHPAFLYQPPWDVPKGTKIEESHPGFYDRDRTGWISLREL